MRHTLIKRGIPMAFLSAAAGLLFAQGHGFSGPAVAERFRNRDAK